MPRKRGKTWYADFYFDGQRRRPKLTGARTCYEAIQAETKLKHDLFQQNFGPVVLKDKPLAQFVEEEYLAWARNNKKQPPMMRVLRASGWNFRASKESPSGKSRSLIWKARRLPVASQSHATLDR